MVVIIVMEFTTVFFKMVGAPFYTFDSDQSRGPEVRSVPQRNGTPTIGDQQAKRVNEF